MCSIHDDLKDRSPNYKHPSSLHTCMICIFVDIFCSFSTGWKRSISLIYVLPCDLLSQEVYPRGILFICAGNVLTHSRWMTSRYMAEAVYANTVRLKWFKYGVWFWTLRKVQNKRPAHIYTSFIYFLLFIYLFSCCYSLFGFFCYLVSAIFCVWMCVGVLVLCWLF